MGNKLVNAGKKSLLFLVLSTFKQISRIKMLLGKLTFKYGFYGYYLYNDALPLIEGVHPRDRIKACIEYEDFRDDDVYLLTYPKSGTGFVADVLYSIYKQKNMLIKGHIADYCKFDIKALVRSGGGPLSDVDEAVSPRVLGTHLPWDLAPRQVKEGTIKTIHCIRNPKDVASSALPFYTKTGGLSLSWNEFIHNYMAGNVIYGNWFDWIKKWYPYRNNKSMLNLYYEDMIEDLPSAVKKIAQFLQIDLTDEQVGAVVKENTFEERLKIGGLVAGIKLRKGKIGSWKADFTVEQNEMADEWIKNESKGLDDLKLIFE